jgi:hypothetical protein
MKVDQLAEKLYAEYQEAADMQEVLKRGTPLLEKDVKNVSQFLAPHPKPLLLY